MAEDFRVTLRLPRKEYNEGDVIEVKAKIKHRSRTGLQLNETASNPFERFLRAQPAVFIRQVEVFYGGELVSMFEMNAATSDDPLLAFQLRADKEAPLRVVVTNHLREQAEATADVVFGAV